MLTPAEKLYSYLQLRMHGYTDEEAEAICGKIEKQMEEEEETK
jgi:hypothetical protein